MKLIAGLGLAALMVVGNASATTIVQVALPTGSYNANTTGNTGSGTFTFSSENFGILSTITSVQLVYETDYATIVNSNGLTIVSTFTPNGANMSTDTLTTTYVNQSTENYVSTIGTPTFTFQQQSSDSNGAAISAGFGQTIAVSGQGGIYGAFSVNWASTVTGGAAGSGTTLAEIVYTYSTSSAGGTPEPVSMVLFGSGLLAVSLIGRKKFFARK